jgi:aryl-alcohol dehydrogenase-like predicted oxidoreductase
MSDFLIGGDLPVSRLGFGAMRLTGPGIWGPPADHDEAIRVLRRAVELGVNFIDTADSYGPYISEELIREALYPYPGDLVIATKAGLVRNGPNDPSPWLQLGRPEYLHQELEMSMRRLGVERIDLFQLHRPDPQVPLADSIGKLAELRQAGKIRHIGLSNVTVDQIKEARAITEIVTVQNKYNPADRATEDTLEYSEAEGIGFIPWNTIQIGKLAATDGPLSEVARETGASPAQVAIAWLLRRSPVMLPIPGTSTVKHLEENLGARGVTLTDAQFKAI